MACHALIRSATADDADRLAGLYARTLRDAYAGAMPANFADPVGEAERASKLRAAIVGSSRVWLLAVVDGEIVGCCGLSVARDDDLPPDFGEITAIAVDRTHRHHGHGLGLLNAARIEAARRAWRGLVLWVVASNADARAFYLRGTFAHDGATRLDERMGFSASVLRYRAAVGAV